ncbi:hypothetical protein WL278_06940 [Staphylococcus caprae]|uniref:hypothetical protein n=1 Tax=Staphylococcus TaxID=1279 RepID=UPI0008A9F3AC|nr:hypothetical protein [Staphylococcus sp. HMSC62A08]OHS41415.1 hypothetical protein HMPREF3264_02025 [Staphylococcus sp. HMSC62A08]
MSIQPWNPALNGNPKLEHKRGQLQVKYTKMSKDFDDLHIANSLNKGTYLGDKEEFNISQIFNKNKNHKFWKVLKLSDNNENLYIVKVSKKVRSKLSNKKVLPKADAYVVEADLSKNYLLEREFNLSEDSIKEKEYNIIDSTGISVKRVDSKRYTIAKFTINTFDTLLKEYENGKMLSLAVFLSTKNLKDNNRIIEGMGLKVSDIEEYLHNKEIINEKLDILSYSQIQHIKNCLNDKIRNIVEENSEIKKAIFSGEGLYEEPYPAHYIFKSGQLTDEIYTNYSITRGSGLSKGKYTIIFKPKG